MINVLQKQASSFTLTKYHLPIEPTSNIASFLANKLSIGIAFPVIEVYLTSFSVEK